MKLTKCRRWIASVVILLVVNSASPALALCEAVGLLAQMHNNLHDVLSSDGIVRDRAAARLYPLMNVVKPREFGKALELGPRTERWLQVHSAVSILSKNMISGISYPQKSLNRYTNDLAWMKEVVLDAECSPNPLAEPPEAGQPGSGGASQLQGDTRGRRDETQQKKKDISLTLFDLLLLIKAILVLMGGAAFLFLRSRRARIMRLGRLPRHSIDLEFQLSLTNSSIADVAQTVSAVDLSLGGMKIKVENVLHRDSLVTMHLPIGVRTGTIVWSNNFFAGVLFDHNLTEDEFHDLMHPNEETAPESSRAVANSAAIPIG